MIYSRREARIDLCDFLLQNTTLDDIRRGFQRLFDDGHGAMRLLMWHPCQKDVACCLLQLLDRIDETLT